MDWAARRRFIILSIIGAVVVAFLATILIATLYETPTCTDGKMNQGEQGVDCGGACAYLCTADQLPPIVLFTQAISNGVGRTDVIALVENKNPFAAAKNVPYRVTLYGPDQSLIQQITGALDLPPASRMPVFIPGVSSGKQTVATAFLEVAPAAPRWFFISQDPRPLPKVAAPILKRASTTPLVETTLTNPYTFSLVDVGAVVLVRNSAGNVLTASATLVPLIPAQGEAVATFTWDRPFPVIPSLIEVIPIVPLPPRTQP